MATAKHAYYTSFSLVGNPSNNCKKVTVSFTFPPARRERTLCLRLLRIQVSQEQGHGRKVLQGSTMDEVYDKLAQRLLSAASTSSSSSKYIVGLAGPPGAGKSTVAKEVTNRVNMLWRQTRVHYDFEANESNDIAISVPMDGFHLYRWQLDAMEDPIEAHARRGAPWTFDPAGLIVCLKSLRDKGCVYVPSFDHGVGDPKENDIFVSPLHRVVVVEGNYLLLDDKDWRDLADIFDERWFLDVDINTALKRVEERFIKLGKNPADAKARVRYNDQKNAELICTSKPFADLVIKSVEIKG